MKYVPTPHALTPDQLRERRGTQPPPTLGRRVRLPDHLDTLGWARLRLGLDVITLVLAALAARFAGRSTGTVSDDLLAVLFPVVVLSILHARRTADERLKASMLDIGIQVLGVVSMAAMLEIAAGTLLSLPVSRDLAVRLWLFGTVYLGLARIVVVWVRAHAVRRESFAIPTLVVGAGLIGSHVGRRLLSDPSYGLRPVGFVDSNPLPADPALAAPEIPLLGGLDTLTDAIRTTGARHVILAFSAEPDHVLVGKIRVCEALGVQVSLIPRLYESINQRTTLDHIGGLPLLTLNAVDPRGWQFAVKHALDRSIALFAVIMLSPVMLTVALLVRLSSPGPILFRQRRVGRDGREFDLLKFRTMYDTGASLAIPFQPDLGIAPGGVEGVDRRTRVGRILRDLSLDEIPQFFNVLRGDMSLVGPRPERPEYVVRFAEDVIGYEDRHRVRSGITGWAQVHGLRGQTSIADRVEWDKYYIQNWSLRLDFRILALTVAEVLRSREGS